MDPRKGSLIVGSLRQGQEGHILVVARVAPPSQKRCATDRAERAHSQATVDDFKEGARGQEDTSPGLLSLFQLPIEETMLQQIPLG
eukprot:13385203-Alexandrium_andersonii.AAC.1